MGTPFFDVNLDGVFHTTRAVVGPMKAERRGRIVTVSSGAGLGVSLTGIQAYASAKAGQLGLTRQLAHELGPWNITVNAVAPGFVLSNPTTQKQWEAYGANGQRRLLDNTALGRLGEVSDIVNGVLFLASGYAGWVSGQTLSIDGGKWEVGGEARGAYQRPRHRVERNPALRSPLPYQPFANRPWPPRSLPGETLTTSAESCVKGKPDKKAGQRGHVRAPVVQHHGGRHGVGFFRTVRPSPGWAWGWGDPQG